jgi:hypothetical protein
MKKETLILLGIIGLGYYLYYRNKKTIPQNTTAPALNPAIPVNETGVPANQTLDTRFVANDLDYRAYFSLSGYKKLGNVPNTI